MSISIYITGRHENTGGSVKFTKGITENTTKYRAAAIPNMLSVVYCHNTNESALVPEKISQKIEIARAIEEMLRVTLPAGGCSGRLKTNLEKTKLAAQNRKINRRSTVP